jgi:hypothetical protein
MYLRLMPVADDLTEHQHISRIAESLKSIGLSLSVPVTSHLKGGFAVNVECATSDLDAVLSAVRSAGYQCAI